MTHGASKCVELESFIFTHSMPTLVGVTGACENTDTLFASDWYNGRKMFLPQAASY